MVVRRHTKIFAGNAEEKLGSRLWPRIIPAIVDGVAPADLTVTSLAKALPYSQTQPEQRDRAKFRIAPEDHPDGRRLGLIHDQFAVLDVIAERHVPAHPHALAFRRRDLVADALASDLALE
jgi:hypothetical protein